MDYQALQQHLVQQHGLINSMVFTERWCEDYHRRQHDDATAEHLGHYHDRDGSVQSEPTVYEKAQHHIKELGDLLEKMSTHKMGPQLNLGRTYARVLARLAASVELHRKEFERG